MKKLALVFALALLAPVIIPGCATPPSSRVVAVQTLKALGSTAKAGMDATTQLLKTGQITVAQWQKVATFYDARWQPAFGFAVAAARSDLSAIASPDLAALATEFAALVTQLTTH